MLWRINVRESIHHEYIIEKSLLKVYIQKKFKFSEKPTEFDLVFHLNLTLTLSQIFRKPELYNDCSHGQSTLRYHSRFFVQVGHETTYAAIGNHHFFTKTCHRQPYQNY